MCGLEVSKGRVQETMRKRVEETEEQKTEDRQRVRAEGEGKIVKKRENGKDREMIEGGGVCERGGGDMSERTFYDVKYRMQMKRENLS